MQVFLTGGSGALGPPLLAELLRQTEFERVAVLLRRDADTGGSIEPQFARLLAAVTELLDSPTRSRAAERLLPIAGDVSEPLLGISADVAAAVRKETAVFIHAAADTRLLFEDQPLRRVNVAGTQNALELARSCARLRQFVQVSTHCVAGRQTGMVREELTRRPPEFLNSYERTKWEAEQLVAAAPFPVQLVRLTSCIGHESTGRCHRVGAIHHLLDWMLRGLLPMIPGTPQTPVDLISHDLAARMLVKAGLSRREGFNVYQVAAGKDAPPLAELLDFLTTCFRDQHPAWRRGQIAPPVIVDAATFQDFRETIVRSRDLLFGQILQAVDAFLPALLYPRSYATTRAEQLWQGPLPKADWRSLIGKVVESRLSSTARAAASVSRNHG